MFFTPQTLAANSRLRGHWADLWANRNIYNRQHRTMVEANRAQMTPDMLACNAVGGFARDFWAEIDNQVIQMRDTETGMEILTDLLAVQTVLPVGKTAKLYNMVGDIADDVSVSLDGQAPFSFDHTEYNTGGDPIPVFTAGYGVNWRHAAGLSTVGLDLVLDSQEAKLRKYNKKLVSYLLDGNDKIKVESYEAKGLRNHANTKKIDLKTAGASGGAINLTTASQTDLNKFFTSGAFGQTARANRVDAYDVVWVSPEIFGNLNAPYLDSNGIATDRTILQVFGPRWNVREFRMTYALSGNELLGYQRRRDVVTPLVGMTTGVVPLPRPLPNVNYNFQIMGAMGIQVKADDAGLSGVVYAADLT
ncbi:major capsid protein [uncultured Castellaniella sp.]|uniref:major capsid protein n=1 Tax=uncultured Castellaniella sp. TaxID=647907 RepID=UPI00263305C7|nr:major capsid protein [uncultured Castellaniella sp.]